MALFIGLISGTSVDGIDAALCEISQAPNRTISLLHSRSHPYPKTLQQQLLQFGKSQYQGDAIDQFGQLDHQVGLEFAQAVKLLLDETDYSAADITAIGSHGQTLRHRPDVDFPFTLQVGDPSIIAANTGIQTVADFRRKDMALGGQGAPFAPAFHHEFFSSDSETRAVINLGGIANVTLLKPGQAPLGYDTGPANTLMDQWIYQLKGEAYDHNGQWAKTGKVVPELLECLLSEPYFSQKSPKSTGCEYFNTDWLIKITSDLNIKNFAPEDVQRTLMELSVITVADSIKTVMSQGSVFVCGGGAHNEVLIEQLQKQLPDCSIANTSELSVAPDWVEAMTFAWFACQTLDKMPIQLSSITGAKSNSILGGVYQA